MDLFLNLPKFEVNPESLHYFCHFSLPPKSELTKLILQLLRTKGLIGKGIRLFQGYHVFHYFSDCKQEFLNPKRHGKCNRTEGDILRQ